MDAYTVGVLTNVGLFSFLALSAYVLLIVGELSFGQQAFFGIGAYTAGVATAMFGLPLAAAVMAAMALGGLAAVLVGLPTLRLRGLYFAIATLAAAEMVRILLELLHWQRDLDGERIGPDGTQGFRGIRWVFERGIDAGGFLALIYGVLAVVVVALLLVDRSRLGAILRAVGEDPEQAASLGIDIGRVKLGVVASAGALAALGGALYAHHNTYVEPRNFDMMLGVHSLAYALVGGLGTAVGPLLGVALDVGLLEGSRVFAGFRMIIFGGVVALVLLVRPRGLLDERVVHALVRRVWPALAGLAVVVLATLPAHAERPQAELACVATSTAHVYDCNVRLWRGGRPLDGVSVVAGADMPSMPLAHAVRPVTAMPGPAPGEYRFQLALEMHGEWVVKLRLSGPLHDQVILHLNFQGTGVAPVRR